MLFSGCFHEALVVPTHEFFDLAADLPQPAFVSGAAGLPQQVSKGLIDGDERDAVKPIPCLEAEHSFDGKAIASQ